MLRILPNQTLNGGCPDCEQLLCLFAWIIGNLMLSLTLSTVVFFVSNYFFTRTLDDAGVATGITRGVLIFSIAPVLSYGMA